MYQSAVILAFDALDIIQHQCVGLGIIACGSLCHGGDIIAVLGGDLYAAYPKVVTDNIVFASEAQYQVQGRFLLNVIIREGASVLELLTGEDEPLLIRRDTLR